MKIGNKKMALIVVAIFFVGFDRFFKILALRISQPVFLIDFLFKFHFTPNPYIAFSIPFSGYSLDVAIGVIIIALIYLSIHFFKFGRLNLFIMTIFVILGAASNLFDRLRYGYVIDYLDFKYFTVFNLADAMIVGGTIGFLFLEIRRKKNLKY